VTGQTADCAPFDAEKSLATCPRYIDSVGQAIRPSVPPAAADSSATINTKRRHIAKASRLTLRLLIARPLKSYSDCAPCECTHGGMPQSCVSHWLPGPTRFSKSSDGELPCAVIALGAACTNRRSVWRAVAGQHQFRKVAVRDNTFSSAGRTLRPQREPPEFECSQWGRLLSGASLSRLSPAPLSHTRWLRSRSKQGGHIASAAYYRVRAMRL
jgi:hypothetical protein